MGNLSRRSRLMPKRSETEVTEVTEKGFFPFTGTVEFPFVWGGNGKKGKSVTLVTSITGQILLWHSYTIVNTCFIRE